MNKLQKDAIYDEMCHLLTDYEMFGEDPGLGRSPEGGHGNPFQYPCLENLIDREA